MESKHATVPTPWYVHKDATGRFYISGHKVAPHPPYICDVYRGNVPDSSGEAHALRIVACVNACEGLPTSALAASALSGGLVPREQLDEAVKALRYPRYGDTARLLDKAADFIDHLQADGGSVSYFTPHLRRAAEDIRAVLAQHAEGDTP